MILVFILFIILLASLFFLLPSDWNVTPALKNIGYCQQNSDCVAVPGICRGQSDIPKVERMPENCDPPTAINKKYKAKWYEKIGQVVFKESDYNPECVNNQCALIDQNLDVKCCLKCNDIFTNLPIDVGPEAKCGKIGKFSEKCKNYFKNNPKTISECSNEIKCGGFEAKKCPEGYYCETEEDCRDCYGVCKFASSLITNDEEKIEAAFNTYLLAEEKCDINLANSVITEKSKEIIHSTCSNMADERKCLVNRVYKVLTKSDTAIIHFDDFSHKTGWPFFFAKENGDWKIDFYKMAYGITMGGSGCDTGWGWRNDEIKIEFCGYFKEGECPEEIDTFQTSQNIVVSTDKLEYTPDEKNLITIKNKQPPTEVGGIHN